jgi:hypothetical protein
MKSMTIIVFALLPLLCHSVLAQTDDCFIYEKVLVTLNKREGEVKYLYAPPFDSTTNFVGIKERVQGRVAWNFLLVNSTYRFSPRMIKQWFAKDVKDTSLISMEFIKGEGDTIINCRFDSTIKYQFCDFFPPKDIWTNSTEIKGVDTIHYSPLRLRFSDVLYSKEGFSVVNVQYTARGTRGRFEWMHCFVFQCINNEWVLKKEAQVVL